MLYRQIYPDPTILNHRFGFSFGLCITGAIFFVLAGVNVLVIVVLVKKFNWEHQEEEEEIEEESPQDYAAEASVAYNKNYGYDGHDEMPRGEVRQV